MTVKNGDGKKTVGKPEEKGRELKGWEYSSRRLKRAMENLSPFSTAEQLAKKHSGFSDFCEGKGEEQIFGDVMVVDEPKTVGGYNVTHKGGNGDKVIVMEITDASTGEHVDTVRLEEGEEKTVAGITMKVEAAGAEGFGSIVDIKIVDDSEDSGKSDGPEFHSQLFDQEGRYMGTYLTSEGRLIQGPLDATDAAGLETEFLSVRSDTDNETCDAEVCEPTYDGLIEAGDKVSVGGYEFHSKENTTDGAVFDIRCAETGEIIASNVVCEEGSVELVDIKSDGKRIRITAYGVKERDALVEIDVEDL